MVSFDRMADELAFVIPTERRVWVCRALGWVVALAHHDNLRPIRLKHCPQLHQRVPNPDREREHRRCAFSTSKKPPKKNGDDEQKAKGTDGRCNWPKRVGRRRKLEGDFGRYRDQRIQ